MTERPRLSPEDHDSPPEDIAGVEHWASVYQGVSSQAPGWQPACYEERILCSFLINHALRTHANSILEIGCGDSVILPFVANQCGAKTVAGIDYEPTGCELAGRRLEAAGVSGRVYCRDVFQIQPGDVGEFDMVFSLGLIEHFKETTSVLNTLRTLVRPGGLLISTVPNLYSLHGFLSWAWQPSLLAKHVILSRDSIANAYKAANFEEIDAHYLGLFSLRIVAWDREHRFPRLQKPMKPLVRRLLSRLDRWWLNHESRTNGWAPFAPYIASVGRRPAC